MSVQEKVFVRKSRRGNVQVVAREHYLRNDLACGAFHCLSCPVKSEGKAIGKVNPKSTVLIPDASALLRQSDAVLKPNPKVNDLVFLQSTLRVVRSKSADIYEQIRNILTTSTESKRAAIFSNENHAHTYVPRRNVGESDDAYDIRQISTAVKWLNEHWRSLNINALILTDASEAEYKRSNIPYVTVKSMADSDPALLELYAQHDDEEDSLQPEAMEVDSKMEKGTKIRRAIYPDFLAERKAKAGIRAGKYFQGTYHPSAYNVTEASVTVCLDPKDKSKRTSVLVVGREHQNRSIDGDIVIIELLPKDEWRVPSNLAVEEDDADVDSDSEENAIEQTNRKDAVSQTVKPTTKTLPTGKVVAIAQRNWRPYCGTISQRDYKGGERALFVPIDRNIPKIRVRSRRVEQLVGKRVLLILDKWDRNSIHPSGHIVREIGSSEDKKAETEVILIENGIFTHDFSKAAYACLPDPSWEVTEEHCNSRRDFRNITICSVDPPGCTDIDDALHFRRLSENEVEVGVHIADVTAFVAHDSVLDKEAAERGCTVYLVDNRFEMLPKLLSGKFCSLQGGEERLAFSALIRMDNDGDVKGVEFVRSVIKSKAALTYEQAQNRIDEARNAMKQGLAVNDEVTVGLLGLAGIAQKLRDRRMTAGALVLASPEVKFKISEARDDVTDVALYEVRETNKMVEEFMLLANIVVAQRLLRNFPQCSMLRRHPKPSEEMFEPLIRAAKSAGFDIDVSNSKRLNDSLAAIEDKAKATGDEYLGTLLRIIATRSMTQAVYFSSGEVSDPEYLHYGLAAPVYTHFTSPIRRYADVLVHRLLAASLGFSSIPTRLQDSKHMHQYAESINVRHKCAQYASRASTLLHTVFLFRKQGDKLEENARILRILGNGLVVLVPRYGVEGVVHIEDEKKVEVNENGSEMKMENGRVLKVLGHVKVRIRVDSAPERMDKVIYELIN